MMLVPAGVRVHIALGVAPTNFADIIRANMPQLGTVRPGKVVGKTFSRV